MKNNFKEQIKSYKPYEPFELYELDELYELYELDELDELYELYKSISDIHFLLVKSYENCFIYKIYYDLCKEPD